MTTTHPVEQQSRWPVVVAALLHLGIAVFPLPASGLVSPAWFLVVVAVGWLVGAVVLWRLAQRAPRRAWLVPVVTLALWFAAITFGDVVLGWTA